MSTTKNGKVDQYNSAKKQLTCQWDPPDFVWKEGKVRTSGNKPSWCNPDSGEFDVTITTATAGLLVHNFVFPVEYSESDPGAKKKVTMFAGQNIPPSSLAISVEIAAAPPSSSPAPADSPSSPPAE